MCIYIDGILLDVDDTYATHQANPADLFLCYWTACAMNKGTNI